MSGIKILAICRYWLDPINYYFIIYLLCSKLFFCVVFCLLPAVVDSWYGVHVYHQLHCRRFKNLKYNLRSTLHVEETITLHMWITCKFRHSVAAKCLSACQIRTELQNNCVSIVKLRSISECTFCIFTLENLTCNLDRKMPLLHIDARVDPKARLTIKNLPFYSL